MGVEQRLSLVTLGVSDLQRARAFYEALGWSTGAEPGDGVVFFQAGGMIVALWSRESLAAAIGATGLLGLAAAGVLWYWIPRTNARRLRPGSG